MQIVTRGREKVCLRIIEAQVLGDIAVHFGQRQHQSGEEGRVCHFIDHAWTSRQSSILNAQVSYTLRDAITRAVPRPHGAVVHE